MVETSIQQQQSNEVQQQQGGNDAMKLIQVYNHLKDDLDELKKGINESIERNRQTQSALLNLREQMDSISNKQSDQEQMESVNSPTSEMSKQEEPVDQQSKEDVVDQDQQMSEKVEEKVNTDSDKEQQVTESKKDAAEPPKLAKSVSGGIAARLASLGNFNMQEVLANRFAPPKPKAKEESTQELNSESENNKETQAERPKEDYMHERIQHKKLDFAKRPIQSKKRPRAQSNVQEMLKSVQN